VEDTWTSRDLPVLDATVALFEEGIDLPEVADIAGRSGLSVEDVARAVRALDGEYVDLRMSMGGPASWFMQGVTPAARPGSGQRRRT
jgi:hypothetical protein